jgi:putative endonuclease
MGAPDGHHSRVTRKYGIKRLVYYESFFAAADAIRREKQIKSYARAKKLAMVSAKGSG